jgi:TonB-linked SusC/RagA family outer membrane protein
MKELYKFKRWVSTISMVLFLSLCSNILAQEITITGKVTDVSTNAPLPGATIQEKGTQNGAVTGIDGTFSIKVKKDVTLVFSFVGYNSIEKPVGESKTMDVAMEESVKSLDEVVVTGYGKEKKVDLIGAISVVNVDKLVDIPNASVAQTLQGRVPGLYMETTGKPSGESGTVLIRGLNTLGDNSPLYIIDGVPTTSYNVSSGRGTGTGSYTKNSNPLQYIDPNSITSIQVLKDASAASIYGARASSGVIIITTKEGQGKVKVQFSTSATMENRTNVINVSNTIQHGAALWQACINDGVDPASESALFSYDYTGTGATAKLNKVTPVQWIGGSAAGKELMQVPGTNWQDQVYQTGFMTNNNLSISGGTDKSSTVFQIGYVKNQGIKKFSDYSKLNLRLNTSYKLFNDKVKVGENLNMAQTSETPEPNDLGGAGMDYLALYENPFMPVYTTDGNWAGPLGSGMSDRNNPLHMLTIHKDNKDNNLVIFGNLYLEYTPIKNLTFRSSLGLDYTNSNNWWIEQTYTEGFLSQNTNSLSTFNGLRLNWTWSNTANYNFTLGKSSVNLMVGMEAIKEDYKTILAGKQNFALQNFNYFQLDAGTGNATSGGNETGYQLLSYFGKVNYNFAEKYLASLTVRYDGSSRFGTNNQFGVFPALNLGWRISGEDFMKDISVISNLKLRAGVGEVGNQKIGNLARFGLYASNYGTMDFRSWYGAWRTIGSAYDINGSNSGNLPSGYIATQQENQNLKWETTDELNIGVDFGLLNNSIYGSFDYFTRNSKDILIQPPYAGVIGEGGAKWENGATISNVGFEGVLGYRTKVGEVDFNITGTISSFSDKVVSLPASVVSAYPGNGIQTILGHSQSAVFGYVTDGLYKTQAEVDNSPADPGKAIGRIRFKDLNGDGKVDALDQTWLGTTLPKYEYGINIEVAWKSFTLSAFLNGVAGKKIFDNTKWNQTRVYPSMNFGTGVFDAWTPSNPNATLPALTLADAHNEGRTSTYMLVNGDYIKLRNLQIAYTLPSSLTKSIKLDQIRVYLMGENLVWIYHNKGADKMWAPDPENPNENYPLTRNYTIGLNVTF